MLNNLFANDDVLVDIRSSYNTFRLKTLCHELYFPCNSISVVVYNKGGAFWTIKYRFNFSFTTVSNNHRMYLTHSTHLWVPNDKIYQHKSDVFTFQLLQ